MTGIRVDACMSPRGMWGVAWQSLSPVDIIGCLGDLCPVSTGSKSLKATYCRSDGKDRHR
jgi:hypothetical protein